MRESPGTDRGQRTLADVFKPRATRHPSSRIISVGEAQVANQINQCLLHFLHQYTDRNLSSAVFLNTHFHGII
jgi:hypothetical protein